MQLWEIKSIFHKELDDIYPKEEVDSFFYMLIEHYLGLERFVLAMQPNLVISKEEEQPLFEALAELRLERPVQYIIGKAHFMGMDFKVNENVLIPRQETEELVRWVLADVQAGQDEVRPSDAGPTDLSEQGNTQKVSSRQELHNSKFVILDIGTGSGCIAVSLAKNLPAIKVHALDVSVEALAVARENGRLHHVDVPFLEVDILDVKYSTVKYDVIVTNPPYVREREKKDMRKNVTNHEPGRALFVSDGNPLKYYDAIARFAQRSLKENGKLYLEINQYLALEIQQLLKNHNFSEIELRKDMFGNDRMMKGKFV